MQQEFIDSVKARLYDFQYSPFLSSYILAWIYWNSKSILIYFSEKLTVNQKIDMLSYNDIEYILPLYFALFYVIAFPFFSAIFYAITLGYRALMNKIQQKIQDITPLPQEKANEIISENLKMQTELTELNSEISKIRSDYQNKEKILLEEHTNKGKDLDKQVAEQVAKETKKLEKELSSANDKIQSYIDNSTIDKDMIKELQTKLKKFESLPDPIIEPKLDKKYKNEFINEIMEKVKKEENDLVQNLSEEQLQILSIFADNDSSMRTDDVKEQAKKKYNLNKTTTMLRLKELENIKMLVLPNPDKVVLLESGLKVTDKFFNNKYLQQN